MVSADRVPTPPSVRTANPAGCTRRARAVAPTYPDTMGRIVVEQHISADGFVAAADGDLSWVDAVGSPTAMQSVALRELELTDAILLGANTYQMFIGYWPHAHPETEPLAGPINALPRHVMSSTLTAAPWGDHEPAIVETGTVTDIADRLTARYQRDIIVWGSLRLASGLLEAGRVDQLRLRVAPVILGRGIELWNAVIRPTRITLAGVTDLQSGQVTLTYDID